MKNRISKTLKILIDTFRYRKIIFELSKNDFKIRYAGSYLGITWGFVQPIITILIYWFVFQVGLRAGTRTDGVPYILWLISGMVPWFFFAEALGTATNSIIEYSYLVKKVAFKVSILPLVKILSAMYIHIFFIVVTILLFIFYGFKMDIIYIQLLYYSFCVAFLVIGLSFITASIVVFIRDITQFISIVLQMGFWITPIVWDVSILPSKYVNYFKFNPLYYITQGYRDTLTRHVWFWNRYNQTIYFWCFSIIVLIIGVKLFKKLRPHFSDVL